MKQSVTFTHAFCQSPICTPSRASFLTGMYPSSIGVNGNGNEFFPRYFEDRLFSHRLARSDYDCGLVGKLHLAGAGRGRENRVNDGYTYFQYSHSHKGPDASGHDYAQWLREQGADPFELMASQSPETYRAGAEVRNFGGLFEPTADNDNIPAHLHQTFWCTERAVEFIGKERPREQPWLLSVNPFDPHPPFDAPFEYYRRYDPARLPGPHFKESDLEHQSKLADAGVDFQSKPHRPNKWEYKKIQASYYATIEQIDHEFGRLLDHLDASGERENTLVIFTSDHGEALGDHGMVLKGCRFFEGMVRVPLMISWPGHFREDTVSNALVELVDLVPTLYEATDMTIPDFVHGKSLGALLRGQSPDHHRDAVRTEFFGAIDHPDQTHATMYRNQKWKLNCFHGKGLCELYDLESDPWEHHDLANHPDFQEMKRELINKSFDAAIFAHPPSPPRTMPF